MTLLLMSLAQLSYAGEPDPRAAYDEQLFTQGLEDGRVVADSASPLGAAGLGTAGGCVGGTMFCIGGAVLSPLICGPIGLGVAAIAPAYYSMTDPELPEGLPEDPAYRAGFEEGYSEVVKRRDVTSASLGAGVGFASSAAVWTGAAVVLIGGIVFLTR